MHPTDHDVNQRTGRRPTAVSDSRAQNRHREIRRISPWAQVPGGETMLECETGGREITIETIE
jgi:hypothetical protein